MKLASRPKDAWGDRAHNPRNTEDKFSILDLGTERSGLFLEQISILETISTAASRRDGTHVGGRVGSRLGRHRLLVRI